MRDRSGDKAGQLRVRRAGRRDGGRCRWLRGIRGGIIRGRFGCRRGERRGGRLRRRIGGNRRRSVGFSRGFGELFRIGGRALRNGAAEVDEVRGDLRPADNDGDDARSNEQRLHPLAQPLAQRRWRRFLFEGEFGGAARRARRLLLDGGLCGASGGGDEIRFVARHRGGSRPRAAERRLRGGNARRRIGAEARRAGTGLERLIGRQVGIDRQLVRRRHALGRRLFGRRGGKCRRRRQRWGNKGSWRRRRRHRLRFEVGRFRLRRERRRQRSLRQRRLGI